jgi:glutamyl-tRNA synthetase
LRPVVLEPLRDLKARLGSLSSWTEGDITDAINATAAAFDVNLGKIGQPLRVAVTGRAVSPPIDVTLALVGRDRTLARLDRAIAFIAARAL